MLFDSPSRPDELRRLTLILFVVVFEILSKLIPLQRQLDHTVQQRLVGHTGFAPQQRIHAEWRKARHRIHFIDQYLAV
ncbi:hypothetical protein D3C73_1590970 [compost metagenome]